jgi:hypothetical protein
MESDVCYHFSSIKNCESPRTPLCCSQLSISEESDGKLLHLYDGKTNTVRFVRVRVERKRRRHDALWDRMERSGVGRGHGDEMHTRDAERKRKRREGAKGEGEGEGEDYLDVIFEEDVTPPMILVNASDAGMTWKIWASSRRQTSFDIQMNPHTAIPFPANWESLRKSNGKRKSSPRHRESVEINGHHLDRLSVTANGSTNSHEIDIRSSAFSSQAPFKSINGISTLACVTLRRFGLTRVIILHHENSDPSLNLGASNNLTLLRHIHPESHALQYLISDISRSHSPLFHFDVHLSSPFMDFTLHPDRHAPYIPITKILLGSASLALSSLPSSPSSSSSSPSASTALSLNGSQSCSLPNIPVDDDVTVDIHFPSFSLICPGVTSHSPSRCHAHESTGLSISSRQSHVMVGQYYDALRSTPRDRKRDTSFSSALKSSVSIHAVFPRKVSRYLRVLRIQMNPNVIHLCCDFNLRYAFMFAHIGRHIHQKRALTWHPKCPVTPLAADQMRPKAARCQGTSFPFAIHVDRLEVGGMGVKFSDRNSLGFVAFLVLKYLDSRIQQACDTSGFMIRTALKWIVQPIIHTFLRWSMGRQGAVEIRGMSVSLPDWEARDIMSADISAHIMGYGQRVGWRALKNPMAFVRFFSSVRLFGISLPSLSVCVSLFLLSLILHLRHRRR